MFSAFIWWISGCFITWVLMKIWKISTSINFHTEILGNALKLTYSHYKFAQDAVILRNDYLLQNNVFTEDEANAKLQSELLEIEGWAEEMTQIIIKQAKSVNLPIKLAFTDWKSALNHIENDILKRE